MNNVGSVAFFPWEKTSTSIFYWGWRVQKRRQEELPRRANQIKVRITSQTLTGCGIRFVEYLLDVKLIPNLVRPPKKNLIVCHD